VCERRGAAARGRLDRRWVAPANYTHRRVPGSVDETAVDEIIAPCAVAPLFEALDVPMDRSAGSRSLAARVAWVGPAAPVPAFHALCRLVRDELSALGLRFDQHAEPHVTLARAVVGRRVAAHRAAGRAPLRIGALTLYESVVAPSGTRYDALEWLPIGRPPQE